MARTNAKALVALEPIERKIFVLRGHRVMLDRDLAEVYGVPTKRLNEQVKRNLGRFPSDFLFRLTRREALLCNRSQSATGSQKHRDPRHLPYAFTEHGAVMVANVLQSPTAVRASTLVVRAFVRLRQILASDATFATKLSELDRRMVEHDRQFAVVFEAIRKLMEPPEQDRKAPVGF